MLRCWAGRDGRPQGALAIAAFLAATLIGVASGAAHAVLLDTEPSDNAALAVSPAELRLRFNEIVTPTLVQILDSSGRAVMGTGALSVIDTVVHLPLPAALPRGTYIVSYRVTSADSHPVGGSFIFGVGEAPLAGQAADLVFPDERIWAVIWTLLRVIFDGALLVAAGGVLFRQSVVPRAARSHADDRIIAIAALIAGLAAVIQIDVRGAQLLATPLSAFWHGAVWRTGFATSLGASVALALAGVILIGAGLAWQSRGGGAALLTGAGLSIASFSVTGHSATAAPVWLTAPVLGLHTLCVAYWVGALPPLYRRLGADPISAVVPIVDRFSRRALYAVAVLILCGLVIAAVQLRAVPALLQTDYGRTLLVKLGLVAVLLLVAALNKKFLTRALAREQPRAAIWLRRMILAEATLIVGILVATAVLGQNVPPREIASTSSGASAMAMEGDLMAEIDATPARAGRNRLVVTLTKGTAPLVPQAVTVWLSLPARGIEPIEQKPMMEGPGVYVLDAAPLPVAGYWTVTVEALITDFEQTNFEARIPIQ
jgi:copper transport protein